MKIAPKLAAGLAVMCAFAAFAAAPAVAVAQSIGVVNIQKVFSELREVKDIKTNFDQKGGTLQAQKQAAEDKVKSLQSQRALMTPGSAEWNNINNDMIRTATEAQVQLQVAQAELVNQQKVLTKQVFDKIDAEVKKLATEKQLTLVLSQLAPEINSEMFDRANPEQLNQALFSRSVLFASPSIDISAELVTRLDAAYAATAPKPATPAAAPAATPAAPR